MEPPQLIKEELILKLREYLKKPENVGFVAGFSVTIIIGFLLISKLYTSRSKDDPKEAADDFVEGSEKQKKGILDNVWDSSLEYGMIFFLTLIKDYITRYLEKADEDITEYKEEITGE